MSHSFCLGMFQLSPCSRSTSQCHVENREMFMACNLSRSKIDFFFTKTLTIHYVSTSFKIYFVSHPAHRPRPLSPKSKHYLKDTLLCKWHHVGNVQSHHLTYAVSTEDFSKRINLCTKLQKGCADRLCQTILLHLDIKMRMDEAKLTCRVISAYFDVFIIFTLKSHSCCLLSLKSSRRLWWTTILT